MERHEEKAAWMREEFQKFLAQQIPTLLDDLASRVALKVKENEGAWLCHRCGGLIWPFRDHDCPKGEKP